MILSLKKKRLINQYKQKIEELESKLNRSQAACLKAILEGRAADTTDIEYHHKYLVEIEELRDKIRELQK